MTAGFHFDSYTASPSPVGPPVIISDALASLSMPQTRVANLMPPATSATSAQTAISEISNELVSASIFKCLFLLIIVTFDRTNHTILPNILAILDEFM